MPPALGAAVSLALRAVWREAWLLAPGFLVTALRRALAWPALAFAWAVAVEAAGAFAIVLESIPPEKNLGVILNCVENWFLSPSKPAYYYYGEADGK